MSAFGFQLQYLRSRKSDDSVYILDDSPNILKSEEQDAKETMQTEQIHNKTDDQLTTEHKTIHIIPSEEKIEPNLSNTEKPILISDSSRLDDQVDLKPSPY